VLEVKAKKEFREKQLSYLDEQTKIKRSNSEDKVLDSALVLSKEEHSRLVSRFRKERTIRGQHH
jgi:hypothetical protein